MLGGTASPLFDATEPPPGASYAGPGNRREMAGPPVYSWADPPPSRTRRWPHAFGRHPRSCRREVYDRIHAKRTVKAIDQHAEGTADVLIDVVYRELVSGSFAEYAVASVDQTARKPANRTFAQAGTVPLAVTTVPQGLRAVSAQTSAPE